MLKTLTITGASDDLIEIDGAIQEEFYANDGDKANLLAFSDGTLLGIEYDKNGIWRVHSLSKGSAEFSKVEGGVEADTFDVATLVGDIKWVVFGSHKEFAQ